MKSIFWIAALFAMSAAPEISSGAIPNPFAPEERQVTRGPGGRILTNVGVWSPDGKWLVYDLRSDPAGELFDGSRIEIVNVESGELKVVYRSSHGTHCGVASFNPVENQIAFIHGPENPTPDWQYSAAHRQGVLVNLKRPGIAANLDAR